MMENYENKVTILQKKEENYKQINKQLKDDRESAVMEKERYQLKESQFDQMVQNVQMKHREEMVLLKESMSVELFSLRPTKRPAEEQVQADNRAAGRGGLAAERGERPAQHPE